MAEMIQCDLAVLGGGPGGYTAAFRAADLGKTVVLIEEGERIGGVCLNVGCIPSKTLLHAAEIIAEARDAAAYGLKFPAPEINLDALRGKKDQVIGKLTGGLAGLAKARKVRILRGRGHFTSPNTIEVTPPAAPGAPPAGPDSAPAGGAPSAARQVRFENAIIAVGSAPVKLPFIPSDDPRIWDSTDALALPFIPGRLAVLGGGIIGLEMAQVYAALGSQVTIIEMLDQIIPPADADLVRPLAMKIAKEYKAVYTSTKLTGVDAAAEALTISLEGPKAPASIEADALLVAVGRRPNGGLIGAENIGIRLDEKGFIPVNERLATEVPNICAVGDAAGNPMLAHKAVHEGKIAAEVIAGMKSAFTPMGIPSVAYTDPEIAWVGYTEKEARAAGVDYEKGAFPWAAGGRALAAAQSHGITKALFHPETRRIIGAGIVGARAGDLIAEAALAIEMGADAADIGATIHAHPTFAETIAFAAETAEGTITDAMPPKKSRRRN